VIWEIVYVMTRRKTGRHECDHGSGIIEIYLTEGIGVWKAAFDAALNSFKDSWKFEVGGCGTRACFDPVCAIIGGRLRERLGSESTDRM
jgi:hypothetical protein